MFLPCGRLAAAFEAAATAKALNRQPRPILITRSGP